VGTDSIINNKLNSCYSELTGYEDDGRKEAMVMMEKNL
jgi:hypothetical protein